jgi:hypothetical protein
MAGTFPVPGKKAPKDEFKEALSARANNDSVISFRETSPNLNYAGTIPKDN